MLMRDLYRLSLHNLLLHKVRSMLTSLGVIFGIASVIAMLAISEGARRQSLAQIEAMGIENIQVISRKPAVAGRNESDSGNQSMIQEYGLTRQDLDHIRVMDNIRQVSVLHNLRKKVLRGTTRLDINLVGVTPSFPDAVNTRMLQGRWLSPADGEGAAPVCVIGRDVRRKYFGFDSINVLGRVIRVEEALFRIAGEIESPTDLELSGLGPVNSMIFIPYQTGFSRYKDRSAEIRSRRAEITKVDLDMIIVRVAELEYINHTVNRIRAYLGKTHKVTKDWDVIVPYELFGQREKTQQIFTVVMGSIAGISLIVGGIGIMNIMLANVYERRKEIGIRRALGARRRDVLGQFIVETVSLTLVGGVLGILVGIAIAEAVAFYAEWPVAYSWWIVASAFGIASSIGILFGTYPAVKAAQQNPIDVLRAE